MNPSSDWINIGLGAIYLNHGLMPQAIKALEMALAINPKQKKAHLLLGRGRRLQKQFPSARYHLEQARIQDENDAEVFYETALMDLDCGDLPKAIENLHNAVNRNPGNQEYQYYLGYAYRLSGKYEQALKYYISYIRDKTRNEWAYLELGFVYRLNKDFANGIAMTQRALDINPSNHAAHLQLAILFRETRKFEPAEVHLIRAKSISPNDANVHVEFGHLFLERNELEQAEQSYLLSLGLNPQLAVLYYHLGEISLGKGDKNQATKYFKKHLELNPASETTRNILVQLAKRTDHLSIYRCRA